MEKMLVTAVNQQDPLIPQIPNAEKALNDLAELRVDLPDRAELERYLVPFPGLARVVKPICERVREAFGPRAQLILEKYKDPEIPDDYLSLCVRVEKYEAGILGRIESVADEFSEQLEAVPGHILVTTDFRRAMV